MCKPVVRISLISECKPAAKQRGKGLAVVVLVVDGGGGALDSTQHDAWGAQEILKLLDLWPSLSSPMVGLAVLGGQQGLVCVSTE